jgi:hypothetical protein
MRFKTWWLYTIIISHLLGYAEASVLQQVVLDSLTDDVILLQRFLHLSSDGPNVNKSLDEEVKFYRSGHADDVGLLNIGTCNLHVVHNAFWQWHEYSLALVTGHIFKRDILLD